MNKSYSNIIIAVSLILIAASSRIVNASLSIPNFVPIAAIGVFSGAFIKDKRLLALLVPILGQLLADVYFSVFTSTQGFYNLTGEIFNFGAIAAATGIGMMMKNIKPVASLACVAGGSVAFFVVSNFGYYLGGLNGYTFQGLSKTFIDAIPFFQNSFKADTLGGVILFGSYFLVKELYIKKLQKAAA